MKTLFSLIILEFFLSFLLSEIDTSEISSLPPLPGCVHIRNGVDLLTFEEKSYIYDISSYSLGETVEEKYKIPDNIYYSSIFESKILFYFFISFLSKLSFILYIIFIRKQKFLKDILMPQKILKGILNAEARSFETYEKYKTRDSLGFSIGVDLEDKVSVAGSYSHEDIEIRENIFNYKRIFTKTAATFNRYKVWASPYLGIFIFFYYKFRVKSRF